MPTTYVNRHTGEHVCILRQFYHGDTLHVELDNGKTQTLKVFHQEYEAL